MVNSGSLKSILTALKQGELTLEGQFQVGSNDTFLGYIRHQDYFARVVYKPEQGEQPLWDFPQGTLSRREVTAFLVSQALGWELVPPTVYRRDGPLGKGSVQLFLEHDPAYHYFAFSTEDRARLKPVAAFDVIINNADRKGGHILVDANNHLWLIDHGVCFHYEDKLRTVIWDFAGQPLPANLLVDIRRLAGRLDQPQDRLTRLLGKLLAPEETQALALRAHRLLDEGVFPAPNRDRRPYPWPPI